MFSIGFTGTPFVASTALDATLGLSAWHDDAVAIISLLHGPNLNLLGQREPHIYGSATLDDYVAVSSTVAAAHGHEIEAFQTNHEGELVDAIHAARGRCAAIVINPGAFTHYAWSLHDALSAFDGPIIEVHISNPNAREPWRHTSVVSPVARGTIVGLGIHGYELAVAAVARLLES
jgi:3-dehydroquinate dehydratase-2